MLADYHMHTQLTDGIGTPRDYAAVAMTRGLTEIGCSDHAPLADRDTVWTMKRKDLPTYVDWVREAQCEFPQLTIRLGLEVDYMTGCDDWVRDLASLYDWDFFLGSVHWLGDFPIDRSSADWIGQDVVARWREYFELWKQAARSSLFDSLAHPDLPKKFNLRPAEDFTMVFADALQVVAAAGTAIEVSTAGLRKPCREIYPSLPFLRLARRHGIPVTLGSDAHVPDECGQDFNAAVAHLRAAGYTEFVRFERRQRILTPLPA